MRDCRHCKHCDHDEVGLYCTQEHCVFPEPGDPNSARVTALTEVIRLVICLGIIALFSAGVYGLIYFLKKGW